MTTISSAQEKSSNYILTSPKDWKGEIIKLPPTFARDMTWKGLEEIRFAPGMFDANSDSFFSYTVLFWLPGLHEMSDEILKEQVLRYYRGLAKSVSQGKISGAAFRFDIDPRSKTKVKESGRFKLTWVGKLTWVESFVTKKKQTLNVEIHEWYSVKAEHHIVFLCISPQERTAEIWQQMRKIRDGFRELPKGEK